MHIKKEENELLKICIYVFENLIYFIINYREILKNKIISHLEECLLQYRLKGNYSFVSVHGWQSMDLSPGFMSSQH